MHNFEINAGLFFVCMIFLFIVPSLLIIMHFLTEKRVNKIDIRLRIIESILANTKGGK